MNTILIRRSEVQRLLREAGISERGMRRLLREGVIRARFPEVLRARRAYFVREEVLGVIDRLRVDNVA
jgi:hypothetical protein